jgi:coenzyme PQQ precursor peptide PqqA
MRALALFLYIPVRVHRRIHIFCILTQSAPKEMTMKAWLKPEITESEAGMEVTSYLPAELDRA